MAKTLEQLKAELNDLYMEEMAHMQGLSNFRELEKELLEAIEAAKRGDE